MNYFLILKLIGNLLRAEALFMLLPAIVSLIYGGEDFTAFLFTIIILGVVSTALAFIKPKDKMFKTKDAFVAVALSWFALSLFGTLPFFFSGCFGTFADCFFESISGFTTTSATVLHNIESLPKGIIFWRSVANWIGGMGVLVFMMAVMPSMNASTINLMRAESTGPSPDRIVPRISETARTMYLIYFSMTILLIFLLMIVGLPSYDAIVHALSTAGTGGFSNMNMSVGEYNNAAVEIILTIFMFLFGTNFALYFYLLKKNFKQFLKDEEIKVYLGIMIIATVLITINFVTAGTYGSVTESLRHSSFQVSSFLSTSGFWSADYDLWPAFSRFILLLLMLTGCCAGSTGGGIKLVRVMLLFKAARVEINKIIQPKSVKIVTISGGRVDNDAVLKTAMFVFIYFMIFVVSTLFISFDTVGRQNDLTSCASAVIAMLSNIGPGFGLVGPTGNYSAFSSFSKIILSFCMLAGRLEFFPVLILFKPSVWKTHK